MESDKWILNSELKNVYFWPSPIHSIGLYSIVQSVFQAKVIEYCDIFAWNKK